MSYDIHTLTDRKVRQLAEKSTQYRLDELVNPSDVQEGKESWDEIDKDVIDREIYDCIEVMLSERQQPFDSLIRDFAYVKWLRFMPRISMDKLATDDERIAIGSMDIWPNHVNKWEAMEILQESGEPPHEFYQEAREIVSMGMKMGLEPKKSHTENIEWEKNE